MDHEVETLRRILRVQIAGIDMAGYVRFSMIAPEVTYFANGSRDVLHREGQLHYNPENYDFCEMFLVDAALRMGQVDFRLWMPEVYGDYDRAEKAIQANGGRLPEDFS